MSPYDQTEYRSFVREICSAPEDDTPRLVVADWLEERGEAARAEFIRVQVELAKLGPPHKVPRYQVEATSLTKYGDRHYSFTGYPDDGFEVGDRVDLIVHRPLRTPKPVKGFRVYRVVDADEGSGELDVYVRLDDKSGPWAGEALAKRERELFTYDNIEKWFTHGLGLRTLSERQEFEKTDVESAVLVERGWPIALRRPAADWLAHADRLYWHPGQTVACPECEDESPYRIYCRRCEGWREGLGKAGRIHRPFPTDSGQTVKCTRCDGDGRIGGVSSDDTYDCSSCNGTGQVATPAVLPHPITEVTLTTRPTGESWYGVNLVNATKCEHTRWPGIKFNITPAPTGAAAGP